MVSLNWLRVKNMDGWITIWSEYQYAARIDQTKNCWYANGDRGPADEYSKSSTSWRCAWLETGHRESLIKVKQACFIVEIGCHSGISSHLKIKLKCMRWSFRGVIYRNPKTKKSLRVIRRHCSFLNNKIKLSLNKLLYNAGQRSVGKREECGESTWGCKNA